MLIDANTKVFEKPPTDTYDAVFADYKDMGEVKTSFKGKDKVQRKLLLIWILDSKDKNGEYYQAVRYVTASMFHKGPQKAPLYDIVQTMLGGKEPPLPFEMETLIGKNNSLFIQQEEARGTMYANIKAIMPAKKAFAVPSTYVRIKDRPANAASSSPVASSSVSAPIAAPPEEEQIPF